ncbi:MAG: VCBS repeat-containing protein [Deltaproteobacteria bacterium]|nr:VCBS repeat-containing protein [Myxococcales bacterium]MDP3221318.1 VCBS repeat-containing protein [Deltaproteobacteria bacterium]
MRAPTLRWVQVIGVLVLAGCTDAEWSYRARIDGGEGSTDRTRASVDARKDIGQPDHATLDLGVSDSPFSDAGTIDSARPDAAFADQNSSSDAPTIDASSADSSTIDATATVDTPPVDVGPVDIGLVDTAADIVAPRDVSAGELLPPRPIAPLSTSMVGARRPRLRWELRPGTDGARVEVCRERSCAAPVVSFEAVGTSAVPPSDLPSGTLFWRLFGRAGTVTGASAGPVWQMTVGRGNAPVDAAWGSVLDVNGDGLAELVVGASARSMVAGAAHVYLGSGSGVSSTASTTLLGPDGPGTGFANTLSSAGDVNGDGFADLLIGTIGGGSIPPRAYLHLGSLSGLATTAISAVTARDAVGGRAGVTLAVAGDVNADGYADVLVGIPDSARFDIYFGSPVGLPASPSMALAGLIGTSVPFGHAIAGACDFNADGWVDIVVGNPSADRVEVFAGGRGGVGNNRMALTNPDLGNNTFGAAVECAGDLNRDGYPDLAVGDPQAVGGGGVYVYHGSASGLMNEPARVLRAPDASGRSFGATLGGGGDLDGDGRYDLVVGGATSPNRVFVYLGSATGLPSNPSVSLDAPSGNAGSFGVSVASVGDVNGDGFDDVLIGAGAETATPGVGTYPGSGRAYLYLGRVGGLATTPVVTLFRPLGQFGFYGSVVAQRRPATAAISGG